MRECRITLEEESKEPDGLGIRVRAGKKALEIGLLGKGHIRISEGQKKAIKQLSALSSVSEWNWCEQDH